MFKHIPSQADLDILIDDDGNLFVFCKQINKVWTGQLTPNNLPTSEQEARASGRALKEAARANAAILESVGVKPSIIAALTE